MRSKDQRLAFLGGGEGIDGEDGAVIRPLMPPRPKQKLAYSRWAGVRGTLLARGRGGRLSLAHPGSRVQGLERKFGGRVSTEHQRIWRQTNYRTNDRRPGTQKLDSSCQNSAAGQDSGFISDKLKTLRLTLAADSRL